MNIYSILANAAISLVINTFRDMVAANLKEGDIADLNLRRLIVRELDDIRSKLVGLARKDLLTSISFFKEGIVILYETFEKAKRECAAQPVGTASLQSSIAAAGVKTVSITKSLKNLRLSDLEEKEREALVVAKKRFEDARRKATEAFSNEDLKPADRILAMKVRVMGTILENLDNPTIALEACRVCLEELHALPVIQKSFRAELTAGFKSRFSKDERIEFLTDVCRISRVIHDVTQLVGSDNKGFLILPCIDVEAQKIDPLRDARISRILGAKGINFNLRWSFGQKGKEEQKLKSVKGISTNSKEQFFVGDSWYEDHNVKVFDSDGDFVYSQFCGDEDGITNVSGILDVASDQDDNVYVLTNLENKSSWREFCVVCVFGKQHRQRHRRFDLNNGFKGRALTVEDNSGQIFVLGRYWRDYENVNTVCVYDNNGNFIFNFVVQEMTCFVLDIAASKNCILVLTADSVHVYNVQGVLQQKWSKMPEKLGLTNGSCQIAKKFHSAGEHVFIVANIGVSEDQNSVYCVSIFTKGGELVYSIHLDLYSADITIAGITVTKNGRIVIAYNSEADEHWGEILVL